MFLCRVVALEKLGMYYKAVEACVTGLQLQPGDASLAEVHKRCG
jgi:hypothetical protein